MAALRFEGDVVGHLRAEALYQIDFPVMQRDNRFYLDHDARGEPNAHGAAFLDEENVLDPRDDNLIVYAHNLSSGQMFGSLFRLGEPEGLARSPFVYFATAQGSRTYVPVAMIRTSVGGEDDFDFMRTRFAQAADKQAFLDEALRRSSLPMAAPCSAEDDLLTLATCSGREGKARLVLLLRALRQEENEAQMRALFQ